MTTTFEVWGDSHVAPAMADGFGMGAAVALRYCDSFDADIALLVIDATEGITGVFFEGGAQLLSEALQARELDYLFTYHAPVLLADEKGKGLLRGLRTETLADAIRLTRVRHEVLGDDSLMRGFVQYPGKMFVDEATFSRKLYGE